MRNKFFSCVINKSYKGDLLMTNTTMKTMNVYEGYITVDVPVQYYAENEERGKELFRRDCAFLERLVVPNGCDLLNGGPTLYDAKWEDLELVGETEVEVA